MRALPTDPASKQESSPTIRMAVAKVLLGAPPAAVAADVGCNIVSLMRWVKAKRRELRKTLRAAESTETAETETSAEEAEAPARRASMPIPLYPRLAGSRVLPSDRAVEPEDSARVAAAYRAVEFDYSGRRIRPTASSPSAH
jgi:hypothetical protein